MSPEDQKRCAWDPRGSSREDDLTQRKEPPAVEINEEILLQTLRERFKLDSFRRGQREAIEALLEHRRLICVQPTGHGKSLLYQLPAVLLEGMTIVISPLLALMRDQIGQLRERFEIPAGSVNSDQSESENEEVLREARAGNLRILFVAPERLDNLESYEFVTSLNVALVVVDEAHCISTWGHDFRPSYRQIVRATQEIDRRNPGLRVLGLTATADQRTEQDIVDQFRGLDGQLPQIHRAGMDRPNISLLVRDVKGLDYKLACLARLLRDQDGCGILYCATREQTEIVAGFLQSVDIDVSAYHAGLDPTQKRALQEGFIGGRPRIVSATNALGMGIDKPDIRFIVHVDVPGSITAYYQEVGRAGRDGDPAEGVLLFDARDRDVQDYFIRSAQPTADDFQKVLLALECGDADHGPIRRDIAVQTGMHPTKVTVILAELQEQGFCEKRLVNRRQCYERLPREDAPDLSRYERQLEIRTGELEAMLRYGRRENSCLMRSLRVALGDLEAPPCGRCSLCNPEAHDRSSPSPEELAAARHWIVHRELVIPPSRFPKMEAGLTLLDGEVRSPLFVDFMRGRTSARELAADLLDLLEARLSALSKRHSFGAVVVIPSSTWAGREQVAMWIAEHLGVTLHLDTLMWDRAPLSRQGELLNNDQRRENVTGRMTAEPTALPDAPVLLLDDYHGSSHTLKEAVRVLRKTLGFSQDVVPLTLARVRWRLGSRGMI